MTIKPCTVNADTRNGGTGADNFDGFGGDDTISGNGGNDTLIGGLGNDSLNGGIDNDTLSGDKGTDTLIGDSDNDSLNGGDQNDTLDGGNGNDKLDGGTGADAMTGGDGNDSYWVDNAQDKIVEDKGKGTDTVTSAVNYTLGANLENLTLLKTGTGVTSLNDSSPLKGTGNALNNVITGNAGNNYLDGKVGDDTLIGGKGDDTLDGGTGKDSLTGGDGSDTYMVTNTDKDVIVETAKDGDQDVVESSVTYTLGNYLEVLTLTGIKNKTTGIIEFMPINGTGNELDNTITGNDAANVLNGYEGNDTIKGGDGDDNIDGGEGDDEIDGGEGNDTVFYRFSEDSYDYSSDDEGKWTVEYVGSESDDGVGEGTDSIIGVETLDFAGEKIDISGSSDDTAPVFASATVSAKTLVLTYTDDHALDAVNKPAITAFKVTAGGVANAVKTVVVNADAHTVTLTLAKAVTASQTVTITYTDPTTGDDSNAIQDVAGNDAAELVFNIAPPNQSPVIVPTTYTISSDTPAGREVARLSTVISDADGKVVKYAITANNTDFDHDGKSAFLLNAKTGILTVNDANDLALSTGAFALKVQATDDDGATATGTITVEVTAPANQAPDAQDDSAVTDAGTSVLIDVLANDSDPDGDYLTITDVSADNGEVGIIDDDGNQWISYTPWGSGVTDTINYTISDGNGGTDTAEVTVEVIEPIPVNEAPIAVDDSAVTDAYTTVLINVLANDSDPDGDFLTIIDVWAENGEFEIVNLDDGNQGISYMPWGSDTTDIFSYTIDDGKGGTDTAEVTVEVRSPNQAPVIADQFFSITTSVVNGDVIGTVEAFDENGIVSYMITNGNVDADEDGTEAFLLSGDTGALMVGDADELAYGAMALTVQVMDDLEATAEATVTIDVTAPPPLTYIVAAETDAVYEGETAYFSISATGIFDYYTMLNYSLSGIDEMDIEGGLDGYVEIYDYATIAVTLANDEVYEEYETLTLTVFDESGFEATASVTVLDNSYWY